MFIHVNTCIQLYNTIYCNQLLWGIIGMLYKVFQQDLFVKIFHFDMILYHEIVKIAFFVEGKNMTRHENSINYTKYIKIHVNFIRFHTTKLDMELV